MATKWNQTKDGNAHVTDGAEGYWATFPVGTSAKEVLDIFLDTADYTGATGKFTVEAEIGGEGDINAQFQAVQDSLNKVTCVHLGMHR